MIRPRSLLEVVAWICVPSTVTGSKCCGERQKLMVSSLVFSRFSWNKVSADQLQTWSTASCALLCCPFGTFCDKVVSSTYFHIPKSALGVTRSLIMSKKSQGSNLVPCGTPAGTAPHSDKQSRLSFTLWDRTVRKSKIQLAILFRDLYFLQFGRQRSMINEIKSLAVVEEENTYRCAVSVCCQEPLVDHT